MQKVKVEEFLKLAKQYPVLDVRSPGEYEHGHIPEAYNLPLFSDEERKVVGTAYVQESRAQAVKAGLDFFSVKMRAMVEVVEQIVNSRFQNSNIKVETHKETGKCVLVHCWRGGMRSEGVAWLLDTYGFKVYVLDGGYKSFRNWVLTRFEQPYKFNIVGGYTGSGKTEILKALVKSGNAAIDLEHIAHHKGSAFGALGEDPQPTQEMFENLLATELNTVAALSAGNTCIWLEDESRSIGALTIPGPIWENMRSSSLYFLDVPFEERLAYITEVYGKYTKEELVTAVMRIQKRLGGLNTKNAVNFLNEENKEVAFRILLNYYDKYYERGIAARKRTNNDLYTLRCDKVDATANSILIVQKQLSDGIAK